MYDGSPDKLGGSLGCDVGQSEVEGLIEGCPLGMLDTVGSMVGCALG